MKVIYVDFSKRGKELYYLKKQLRKEQKENIDNKIDRILTYQYLKESNRLLTTGDFDEAV